MARFEKVLHLYAINPLRLTPSLKHVHPPLRSAVLYLVHWGSTLHVDAAPVKVVPKIDLLVSAEGLSFKV